MGRLPACPQRERRRLLEQVVSPGREGAIRLFEEVPAEGEEFLRVACAHGLEGIIAKHRERPYRSGRRLDWLKITCTRRDSFVIVGFEPSTVPGAIGRLLLAVRKAGELVYVGGCGTGWTREESVKLRELLEEIETDAPAVDLKRKGAIFTEPFVVAEVECRAWTDDGRLRHPSFKGLGNGRTIRRCLTYPRGLETQVFCLFPALYGLSRSPARKG